MLRLLVTAILTWVFAGTVSAESLIRMSGSTTVAPIAKALMQKYREAHVETLYDLYEVGCFQGVHDVGNGEVEIGLLARDLKKHEKGKYSALTRYVIGFDGVAVIVNAANPVDELSHREMRNVLLGKTRNWSKLSGPDAPITPLSEAFGRSGFEAMLYVLRLDASTTFVDGETKIVYKKRHYKRFSKHALGIAASNQDMITRVAADPNAIGYTSSVEALAAIRMGKPIKIISLDGDYPSNENIINGRYPIRRELSLVVPEPIDPKVQDFIQFATSIDAKMLIESLGYPTSVKR